MKRGSFAAGFLTCLLLAGVTTTAYAAGIVAERSHHRIVVDGKEAQMEAYVINGNNYVKLRDIGEQVGFNVYWNAGVQIDTGHPYTGIAPAASGIRVSSLSLRPDQPAVALLARPVGDGPNEDSPGRSLPLDDPRLIQRSGSLQQLASLGLRPEA